MIVQMNVNELTENANMVVSSCVKSNLLNPIIHLTVTNDNNEPFDVRSFYILTIENGNLISKPLIVSSGRTVKGNVLTLFYGEEYLFVTDFDDMYDKMFVNMVNVELITDGMIALKVIDPTEEASAKLVYYHNPLPPE